MYTIVFVDFLFRYSLYIVKQIGNILWKVFIMSKPTTEFNLGLRDIDLIEDAINSVIARRSSAMSSLTEDNTENTTDMGAFREIRQEVADLRDLLGRLHNQKNWYRPQTEAAYVSG